MLPADVAIFISNTHNFDTLLNINVAMFAMGKIRLRRIARVPIQNPRTAGAPVSFRIDLTLRSSRPIRDGCLLALVAVGCRPRLE